LELLLSHEDLRTLIMDAAFPAWPFSENPGISPSAARKAHSGPSRNRASGR
jgi:hypothetical protein